MRSRWSTGSLARSSLCTLLLALAPACGDDAAGADAGATAGAGQGGQAGAGQAQGGQAGAGQAGQGGQAGAGQAGQGGQAGAGQPGQGGQAGAGQGGGPLWAKTLGSKGEDAVAGVSVDAAGHALVAGYFSQQLDTGAAPLDSAGDRDGFVVHLDASGGVVWATRLGGVGFDAAGGAVFGGDGAAFVAGVFSGEVTLGPDLLTSKGGTDMFVARLDATGAVVWARRVGGADDDIARSLAVMADGSLAVVGIAKGEVDAGGKTLACEGEDAVLLVVDPAGTLVDARRFGGPGSDGFQAVAVGPDGDLWLSGLYGQGVDVGTGPLPWAEGDGNNGWVLRAKPTGQVVWAKGFGGPGTDAVTSVAVAPSGESVITVAFEGMSLDLGQGPQPSAGFFDMGVARLAPDGAVLWGRVLGTPGADGAFGCALTPSGDAYVVGAFSQSIDLGGATVEGSGFVSSLIWRLDPTGKTVWARELGPTGINNYGLFQSVAVGADGAATAVGRLDGSFDFGTGEIAGKGGGDVFVVRFAP